MFREGTTNLRLAMAVQQKFGICERQQRDENLLMLKI